MLIALLKPALPLLPRHLPVRVGILAQHQLVRERHELAHERRRFRRRRRGLNPFRQRHDGIGTLDRVSRGCRNVIRVHDHVIRRTRRLRRQVHVCRDA